MTGNKSMDNDLECLNVQNWRVLSKQEFSNYFEMIKNKDGHKFKRSDLVVRTRLTTVDMYSYLKARFGEPNGFQNFLRRDDSDNWIHWEFTLLSGTTYISICGTSRETLFLIFDDLSDDDWHSLIDHIKNDFKRVGKAKGEVLNKLERWAVFPNKFVQISNICADLHHAIDENIGSYERYNPSSVERRDANWLKKKETVLNNFNKRAEILYRSCLELSLITPVLAEAFINMIILMLCKKEIKNNVRQFDSFIRSQIDAKLFDLYYKCEHFIKPIDPNSDVFKRFKRVMDKRNHVIHGNIDPAKEQTEEVYFDGKRPLFSEAGDHIEKQLETLERQYRPQAVLTDYIDTHMFLMEIVSCIDTKMHKEFWQIMECSYPGYDYHRQITGKLFPGHSITGILEGQKYDDELTPRTPPSD